MSRFEINVSELAMRVQGDRDPETYVPIYRCIERIAAGMAAANDIYCRHNPAIKCFAYVADNTERVVPSHCVLLNPQCTIEGYRVDFVLSAGMEYVAIECDGHDFHERTADQAEKDRSRDRVLQKCGVDILRFTGREINRDPVDCARQTIDHLTKLLERSTAMRKIA